MRDTLQPYPDYKDSGIEWLGDVPKHWQVSRLDYITRVKARLGWKGLTASEYVNEGYAFLATPNIKGEGEIDFTNVNYITEERYLESPEIMLEEGDVLIAKDGSTLGITNYVRSLPEPATVNSSIAVVRPRPDQVYCGYLFRWLSADYMQATIQSKKDGQGVPHLFQSDINKFTVILPPLDEQRAIANFLDAQTAKLDRLLARKRDLIERLKEKRSALICHAVTRGLNPEARLKPSGIDWLGDIPEHWEVKRLKHLISAALQYGANEAADDDDPNQTRYVRITDIDDNGRLRDETFRSLPDEIATQYLLEDGDLLFARSGATSGKTFLYQHNWGRCAYAGYLIRARFNKRTAHANFIKYFTESPLYWDWLSSIYIQATIQNVSAEKYGSLTLPLPPLAEQTAIADYLDRETAKIDGLIAKVEAAMEKLVEYRSALITAAVTGKIDVRAL